MFVMQDSRYNALELAIRAFPGQTVDTVISAANAFANFLTVTEGGTHIPVAGIAGAGALETSEAEATEPQKPAKATTKAKPAAKPETKVETPAEPVAPTAKTEAPKEEAPAKPAAKEATMTEAQQAVVKLVTKLGREATIKFMQVTFGSPNVSGLDLTKHSYASVISTIADKIKEAEQATAA